MSGGNVSIIVAVTRDNAIGRGGDLIFRLRGDMRHFKAVTMGHPVIMGRKTWESLPNGALPGRRNMVISRNKDYRAEGAEVFGSLESALEALSAGDEAMVIGGAQIYGEALALASRLYLTVIDAEAGDADTFFPEIGDEWVETDRGERFVDEASGLGYRFVCLSRK